MRFIETPPHLIPQPTRLFPLRELPPAEFVDEYASTDDLLRDARDYTVVLDFNVNIPAEHANADSVDGGLGTEPILEPIRDVTRKKLLIPPANLRLGEPRPRKRFPGEYCRRHRRLLLRRTRCRRTIRQRQRPLTRPLRRPLQYYQKKLRVAPHVRRHAANLRLRERARQVYGLDVHCTTCARALYSNVETHEIAHHLENAPLFGEYAYVSTASTGNHSGRGKQTEGTEHFQEGYEPPPSGTIEGGGRQGDRQPQEARHLRAGTCVPRPRWTKCGWLTLGQQDQGGRPLQKSSLVVLGWVRVPGIDYGGTFAPVCRLQRIQMILAIAAELNYEVLVLGG